MGGHESNKQNAALRKQMLMLWEKYGNYTELKVSNLPTWSSINEKDIRDIFEYFGDIEVSLETDTAYLSFKDHLEA